MGLRLTAQGNASKEAAKGIIIYPDKVYLYWQVNMKIASMALSMQTLLELDRQICFKICELVFNSKVVSK